MTDRVKLDIDVVARTDTGRQRRHNEDAFLATELGVEPPSLVRDRRILSSAAPGSVFMVADGMGGAAAGEVASQMSVEAVHELFVDRPPPDDLDEREAERLLREAVVEVNGRVHERASRESGLRGMGATLTMVWIRQDVAHLVQVGDSRAYLLRDDELQRLTRDQSLVEHLVESKKITPEEAVNHQHANVILQAIGVRPELKPVTSSVAVQPGDRILICSDGLTGPVNDDEIAQLLAHDGDLEVVAESLIALANERGGPDNITVVIMRVEKAGTAETLVRRRPASETDTLIEAPTVPASQRATDDTEVSAEEPSDGDP